MLCFGQLWQWMRPRLTYLIVDLTEWELLVSIADNRVKTRSGERSVDWRERATATHGTGINITYYPTASQTGVDSEIPFKLNSLGFLGDGIECYFCKNVVYCIYHFYHSSPPSRKPVSSVHYCTTATVYFIKVSFNISPGCAGWWWAAAAVFTLAASSVSFNLYPLLWRHCWSMFWFDILQSPASWEKVPLCHREH